VEIVIRQGDVFWTSFPEPLGDRPAVVLTRTPAIRKLTNVTVVPLTSVFRAVPAEVVISTECGLSRESIANLDNILTVPKSDLRDRAGTISAEELDEIMQAFHFVFDMPF